jgi:hypothetical protein
MHEIGINSITYMLLASAIGPGPNTRSLLSSHHQAWLSRTAVLAMAMPIHPRKASPHDEEGFSFLGNLPGDGQSQ